MRLSSTSGEWALFTLTQQMTKPHPIHRRATSIGCTPQRSRPPPHFIIPIQLHVLWPSKLFSLMYALRRARYTPTRACLRGGVQPFFLWPVGGSHTR